MSVSKLTLVKLGSEISTAGLKPLHPQVESDSTPGVATAATLTPKASPTLDLEKSSIDDNGGGVKRFHPLGIVEIAYILLHGWRQI